MRSLFIGAATALTLLATGCSTTSPDVVSRNHAQQLQTVRVGTVLSVRPVVVDGKQSGVGAVTGGVVGGIVGSNMGGHKGNAAATLLLGVGGAVLGNAIERATTQEGAVEITLRMQDGTRTSVVQAKGAETFQSGDRVEVVSNGRTVRVYLAR